MAKLTVATMAQGALACERWSSTAHTSPGGALRWYIFSYLLALSWSHHSPRLLSWSHHSPRPALSWSHHSRANPPFPALSWSHHSPLLLSDPTIPRAWRFCSHTRVFVLLYTLRSSLPDFCLAVLLSLLLSCFGLSDTCLRSLLRHPEPALFCSHLTTNSFVCVPTCGSYKSATCTTCKLPFCNLYDLLILCLCP